MSTPGTAGSSSKSRGKRKATDASNGLDDASASTSAKRVKATNSRVTPNRPSSPAPSDASEDPYTAKSKKTVNKGKGKKIELKVQEKVEWPAYFDELFKLFKALNTVIAFCSSRQHIATTFSVVRSSVEGLLKRPLDLVQVAEIKAIIPDLMRFAYISSADLRIHSDNTSGVGNMSSAGGSKQRAVTPDFSIIENSGQAEEDEHVLVLDFVESSKKKTKVEVASGTNPNYALPPSMNPLAVKKLIEKRNERFVEAVNELLLACTVNPDGEDPVALVMKAAKDHLPADPSGAFNLEGDLRQQGIPGTRLPIEDIVDEILGAEDYRDQLVGRRIYPAKEPQWGELSRPLSKTSAQGLQAAMNVTGFYSHQTAAINALADGKHVIVSTGTASGKSIIYQVPLLRFLEEDRDSTAIFIFPTKALAQDQKTALEQLLCRVPGLEDIQVATYDGDTPMSDRADIRQNVSVIFTNFDMLHITILPQEDQWRRFLKNMKLVVVDELHYYHGTLGSHAALIMRRLRRVCTAIGNRRSQFVSCSATIGQPLVHMTAMFGIDNIEVITQDGAPAGRKDFLVWNPPLIDEMNPKAGRSSSINEACAFFRFLVKRGVKTIIFCKIRKSCELVMKTLRTQLANEGRQDILEKVRAYRSGYSQQDRRAIEKEAFSGKLVGIVATNALELGINIGTLDAVIMLGFPMSVASLRQQAGRAGRRAQGSLAVYVADNLPIDQHFINNPEEVFDKPMADLVVDLDNEVILEGHLQCAANEMPISLDNDEQYFGPKFKAVAEQRLVRDAQGWHHTHPKYKPRPSAHVAIRGAQEVKYTVLDVTNSGVNGRVVKLEELELSRALFETYEGGIFMHQGMTYLVREVSHDDRTARIVQSDVNWTTTPRDFTDIDPIKTTRIRAIRGSPHRAFYGPIACKTIIFGFYKVRNNAILDVVDLDTPPFERETNGMWIDVPGPTLDLLRRKGMNPAEAIHAAEHVVLNLAPLFALASAGDVRTECKVAEKEYSSKPTTRKRPARLIFYDSAGKCSGVAAKAFDHTSDMLTQALERLEACECEEGCPSCIEDETCKQGNLVASKAGARVILHGVLNLHLDEDTIPNADPDAAKPVPETIVAATAVYTDEGVEIEYDECGMPDGVMNGTISVGVKK